MTRFPLALAAVAALGTAACSTDYYGNQHINGAGRGALIGGAGGAVVGALTGNPALGAAIGAAGGAVVGAVADDHNRYEDRNGRRYYYESDNRRYHYDNGRDRVYDPY